MCTGVFADEGFNKTQKEEAGMAKAKRGDKFGCAECGLVVVVDEGCGCATADILCCGEPMVKGDIKTSAPTKKKAAAKKAPKKAAKKVK